LGGDGLKLRTHSRDASGRWYDDSEFRLKPECAFEARKLREALRKGAA